MINERATFILGVSAKKQSGKDTLCQGLKRMLPEGMVEIFNFADALKDLCINVLGLRHEQVWGSDLDKNTPTEYSWDTLTEYIRWSNGSRVLVDRDESLFVDSNFINEESNYLDLVADGYIPKDLKTGPITARQLMQIIGTDIMRNMLDQDIWVKALFRRINKTNPIIAMIPDVRFPTEVESIFKNNGWTIRLTRNVTKDNHPSETSLDNYDWSRYENRVLLVPSLGIEETKNFVCDWLRSKAAIDETVSDVVRKEFIKL